MLAFGLILSSNLLWVSLIVVLGLIALVILWRVPKLQVKNLSGENAQDEHRKFELENEARKTIAQVLGGAVVLAGVFFTAEQLFIAQDAQRVAEEAQITERFTRATEQLGDDKLEIRIGGIYAFERIAKNSTDDFYSVVNILSTFIRENAPSAHPEQVSCETL